MENKELSGFWKIVCWILTAVVMFLLGALGIFMADAIGSRSRFFAYGGFLIGWSSYGLIKAILLKLTQKVNDDMELKLDYQESISYSTENCIFDDSQKITHELRRSTLKIPFVWKYYIDFVIYALGESAYKEQYNKLKREGELTDDYCQEIIGANYAKEHIFNDTEWSSELQRDVANSDNTLDSITIKMKSHIKDMIERINNANQSDDEGKDEFIILTGRIGARKLWADMFEYSYKLEQTNRKK